MLTKEGASTNPKKQIVFGDPRPAVYISQTAIGFLLFYVVTPIVGGAIGGAITVLGIIIMFSGIGNASYAVAKKSNWVLGVLAFFVIFWLVAYFGELVFPTQ